MRVRICLLNVCFGFALVAAGCKSEESPGARSVDDEDMQSSTDDWSTQTSTTSPDTGREAGRAEPEKSAMQTESPTAMQMNDGEVAGVLSAANQKEIEVSKLVHSRTKDASVKSFASMMMKDHQDAANKMNAMMTKTGLTVETSEKADELRQSSTQASQDLADLSGAELDRAYMTMMIEDHRKVLDFIDNEALPNVDDDQLKALITELRPTIEMHFQRANEISDKLGEAGTSSKQQQKGQKQQPGQQKPQQPGQQQPGQQQPGQQQPGQQKPGQQQPGT